MSTGLTGRFFCLVATLLSFERPPGGSTPPVASADLENCTRQIWVIATRSLQRSGSSHRQDVKGTRWMPWHQETKKDVDGCDKPRLDAEQSLTRGSPNRETRRR
jgi:hypothetical protein